MKVESRAVGSSLLTGLLVLGPTVATLEAAELPTGVRRLSPVHRQKPLNSCVASPVVEVSAPRCENGAVLDDGTVEGGLSFSADTVDLVMLLDVGLTDALIEEVCVCWTRDSSSGPELTVPFEIVMYEQSINGEPGSVIGVIPVSAADVPEFPDSRIYRFDLSGENLRSPDEEFFVGVSWFANTLPEFFVCTDLNGPNAPPLFFSADLGTTWSDLKDVGLTDIQALVIRATTENDIFKNGFESGDLSAWTVPGSA